MTMRGWIQERNNKKDRLEGYIIVWAKNQFWYNFEIAFVQAQQKRQIGFGNVLIGNDLDFPDMFNSF